MHPMTIEKIDAKWIRENKYTRLEFVNPMTDI